MLTIFIPLLVDEVCFALSIISLHFLLANVFLVYLQSSFFAHFMCFEVPTLVPSNKNGSSADYENDDDLSPLDMDGNDIKAGNLLLI